MDLFCIIFNDKLLTPLKNFGSIDDLAVKPGGLRV
jgi:hypothetical protein